MIANQYVDILGIVQALSKFYSLTYKRNEDTKTSETP